MIMSYMCDLLFKIYMDPTPPPNQGAFGYVYVFQNTILVNYAIWMIQYDIAMKIKLKFLFYKASSPTYLVLGQFIKTAASLLIAKSLQWAIFYLIDTTDRV